MVHAHNMNQQMKNRFRVFRRGWGTYYCEDLVTKQQYTLKTRDKDEAFRLVAARNETEDAPAFSLHLARPVSSAAASLHARPSGAAGGALCKLSATFVHPNAYPYTNCGAVVAGQL